LRQVARQKESLKKGDLRPAFSKKYRQLLQKDYDAGQIAQMEQMLGVLPPLDISVSKDAPKWAEKLGGILFENGTIRLTEPNLKITELAGFSEGAWWVQDLAASLPVALLGDVSGQKILDLCAAPGGKTAQLLAKGAYVTAVDIDPIRLEKLRENIDRLQLSDRLTAEVSEGLAYLTQTEKRFDAVVLDVPCSATGTFRRHPEVVHIKTKEDVDKQLAVQARLLENAALCLNDGGRILYCTCSIAHAEGEEQIARFLENHPDFEIIEHKEDIFALTGGKRFEKHFLDKGLLRTLPYNERQTGGMDAFFAVCIRKSSA
jgi:16S rRNA (cytosine967-C5)-methyltransferase